MTTASPSFVALPSPLPSFETLTCVNAEAHVLSLAACEYALESEDTETGHKAIALARQIRRMEEYAVYEGRTPSPILHNLRLLANLKGINKDGLPLSAIAICKEFKRLASLRLHECVVCKVILDCEEMRLTGCCDAFICNDCECACPPSPEIVADSGASEPTWDAIHAAVFCREAIA
jgi:hypothetical protein